MSLEQSSKSSCVGIIANPVSARDIRRIVANASNLQTSERVSIVLRLLSTLAACGVDRILMMPDKAGISSMLLRSLNRERNLNHAMPELEFVPMNVTSTVDDTFFAARYMQEANVSAIIVLGGDGTHRAVVRELIDGVGRGKPAVPIAGISSGTNNAFPEMREPTMTAMAVGLYATGKLTAEQALAANKVLEISIDDGLQRDIAIVDTVISSDRFVGTRALWKTQSLRAVYLTFADPEVIGMAAIGGLLEPLARGDAGGLAVTLRDDPQQCCLHLDVPIAPGMICEIGIENWQPMPANQEFTVPLDAGVVALDGERELLFEVGQQVSITLRENAFPTVDISKCMRVAACEGLFRHTSPRQ